MARIVLYFGTRAGPGSGFQASYIASSNWAQALSLAVLYAVLGEEGGKKGLPYQVGLLRLWDSPEPRLEIVAVALTILHPALLGRGSYFQCRKRARCLQYAALHRGKISSLWGGPLCTGPTDLLCNWAEVVGACLPWDSSLCQAPGRLGSLGLSLHLLPWGLLHLHVLYLWRASHPLCGIYSPCLRHSIVFVLTYSFSLTVTSVRG